MKSDKKEEEYSLMIFMESIKSKVSQKTYLFHLEKFRKYSKQPNYDSIITIGKAQLQKIVEAYTIQLKKEISPNSMKGYLIPIRTFLEVNDIDLNWRKIKRLFPAQVKISGLSAYSTEDIQKMLGSILRVRNKAIIHFIASSALFPNPN